MPDYTQQLNAIVELTRRQPAIPQWTIAIMGAGVGGLIGFASSLVMSIVGRWKDRRSLEASLYTELDLIFRELKDHVEFLKKQPDQTGPSETNFSEFIKADLFDAVKGTPLFWNLRVSGQLLKLQRELKRLGTRTPSNIRGDVINIEMVLRGIAGAFPTGAKADYLKGISNSSD
jgi:hypothetical protein